MAAGQGALCFCAHCVVAGPAHSTEAHACISPAPAQLDLIDPLFPSHHLHHNPSLIHTPPPRPSPSTLSTTSNPTIALLVRLTSARRSRESPYPARPGSSVLSDQPQPSTPLASLLHTFPSSSSSTTSTAAPPVPSEPAALFLAFATCLFQKHNTHQF